MKKYLDYVKNRYGDFRYLSDKNILENIDFFENINYKIISNEIGFCIIFKDLRVSENICFFGFIQIYEKSKVKEFFDEIKNVSKKFNCKKLIGPINFSVWNNYRFGNFETNNEIILGEYYTDSTLNNLLSENNFKIYEKYITAKRKGKNPYKINENFNDYEIQKIDINKNNLKLVYDLSSKIFTQAPKIKFFEFEKYMQVYLNLYKNNISEFILTYKGQNIGFLSSFYTKQYFVIKTVGILKEFRGKGLGNFLLYYVYDYYLNLDYNISYYLYMREKGDALNMTHKNAEIFREYFTYYIEL